MGNQKLRSTFELQNHLPVKSKSFLRHPGVSNFTRNYEPRLNQRFPKALRARGAEVVTLLRNHPRLFHLRLAQDGTPVHPLYLPSTLRPKPHTVKP